MVDRFNHILSYFTISLILYYIVYIYEILRNKTFVSQRIAYSHNRTMWLDLQANMVFQYQITGSMGQILVRWKAREVSPSPMIAPLAWSELLGSSTREETRPQVEVPLLAEKTLCGYWQAKG